MMTVHAAKGLEFPYVFLCGMNEGIFPSRRVRTLPGMEEERRLAFVALTRAEKGLYLSEADGRNFDGSPRYPSRFLLDIDRELLSFTHEVDETLLREAADDVARRDKYLREDDGDGTLPIGQRVRHAVFGEGTVLDVDLSIPSSAVPVGVIWVLAFLAGCLSGALWGAIPGLVKALLNINEVLACIMTNWIAANLVTWMFDISNFKNMVESTKSGYIYKTTFNGVATPKLGLDAIFPGSQVNGGILVAIVIAIAMYILMNKTTLGYELKACGANRHAARYAGIRDKRNIVLSMAIAGALAGAGAALYWLSGNTEFYWSTYQALPAVGFNGIPVALLALNNPIAVIFTGIFMAMLNIVGLQLTNLTAYNEYITDVIISVIVYLSAFSLAIRMMLSRKKKPHAHVEETAAPAADAAPPEEPAEEPTEPAEPVTVQTEEGGDQA